MDQLLTRPEDLFQNDHRFRPYAVLDGIVVNRSHDNVALSILHVRMIGLSAGCEFHTTRRSGNPFYGRALGLR